MLLLLSCKNELQPIKETETAEDTTLQPQYPAHIAKIFNAHGGIQRWDEMNSLAFTIEKETGNETHLTDLKSRKVTITTEKYRLGFDGDRVWLAQDSLAFKPERARFYHNLMFYFYAMPFVLGDDGITYSDAEPLEFEDTFYPGTKISFGEGVGDAPDDNYIIYSDPNTNQMVWLAYTVTYGDKGPSDTYSFIKYDQWQEVNGLKLPSVLQWYTVTDGKPTVVRNSMKFITVKAQEASIDNGMFSKPANGNFVK